MGFFDRFSSKKPAPAAAASPAPASEPTPLAAPVGTAGGVKPRLAQARERIEAKDLPGALAIYEEVLGTAGDRADVLVAISGDLGSHGHVAEIIELIAPRYDADRHGPATGLNLLQAYLAVRNADAAQHVLDILFALNRPELEERLHGFSNAIAEILASPFANEPASGPPGDAAKIGLISISKPIWFYGLEAMAPRILPPKEGRLRRISFAQLALPGLSEKQAAIGMPRGEDELGRLSRGIPLWLAETFYFSPLYSPTAAVGLLKPPEGEGRYVTFGAEWTTDNLRQLVDTTEGGLDYIVSGALHHKDGDYDVLLRIWDVRNFRERRTFSIRWTPGTADTALAQLHAQVKAYMEWSPSSAALAYSIPVRPRAWVETLGAALGLFLLEKGIVPKEQLAPVADDVNHAAKYTPTSEAASLAFLTLRARAKQLGFDVTAEATLARSALVAEAQTTLG